MAVGDTVVYVAGDTRLATGWPGGDLDAAP